MNIRIRIRCHGAALGMLVLSAGVPVFADTIVSHSNVDHSNVDHFAPQGTTNEGDGSPPPIMGPPPPSGNPTLDFSPLSDAPETPVLTVPGFDAPAASFVGPAEQVVPPAGSTTIPEPATAALLLISMGVVMNRRRR